MSSRRTRIAPAFALLDSPWVELGRDSIFALAQDRRVRWIELALILPGLMRLRRRRILRPGAP